MSVRFKSEHVNTLNMAISDSSESSIVCEQVCASYGSVPVLKNITLNLESQKTHVFLGPSGSGKSTSLRTFTGLLIPTSGSIRVLGKPVQSAQNQEQRLANQRVGFMLQEGALFPHLSVFQNATLPGQLAQFSLEKMEKRMEQLEQLVDLDSSLRQRRPHELSGGQKQRVSMMRALFLDPPILLLDEPFSALDPHTRTTLQQQMKSIFAQLKKTVILVTHDISEAAYFADTVSLFENGCIAQHGLAKDVLRHPTSVWAKEFISASIPRWKSALHDLSEGAL
jgi:osmoprotectant transport system ATP-binding protein